MRQEGVDGWRVAQERAVWEGWAGEVMGASWLREGGRVWVEGKRMGDMKGLERGGLLAGWMMPSGRGVKGGGGGKRTAS